MGNSSRRRNARRKQPGCTSKLTCKVSAKVSGQSAHWSNLPEGPLLRMFEVMAGQEDGRSRVSAADTPLSVSCSVASPLFSLCHRAPVAMTQKSFLVGEKSSTGVSSVEDIGS